MECVTILAGSAFEKQVPKLICPDCGNDTFRIGLERWEGYYSTRKHDWYVCTKCGKAPLVL